ncbi:hypothetical protein SBRCBS47491_008166 [Sporothrix bragantina]|uniref:Tyrosyl-DNA phosphodiesterase 1 n=1 Tax=Sporothrix bragantina TaxID=671064 RepID=A0ABP0CLQ5_9PEZI
MDELALRQLNGGEDEDEALRRALAMSMGESEGLPEGVESEADEKAATPSRGHIRSASTATTASEASIASSASASPASALPQAATNDSASETAPAAAAPNPTAPAAVTGIAAPASSSSLLALDRKAMEAERLARRQKFLDAQQAQTGTPSTSKDVQPEAHHLKQSWKLHLTPKKRKAEDDVIVIDSDDDDNNQDATKTKSENKRGKKVDDKMKREKESEQHPSRKRRLEDGSQEKAQGKIPPPAPLAYASQAFSTSSSAHFPYAKGVVKKTWVRGQPRNGDDVTIDEIWQKNDLELAVLSSFQWDEEWMLAHLDLRQTRVMLIAFAVDDHQTMGYMHSKLQLLKFPGHLRLVIPTGNLGVDTAMVQSLTSYDFSETARYAFVHSIAGSHMGESWKRTGYSGLGRAVQTMGWASSKPIQADYLTASIGSISDDLITALYNACQGVLPHTKLLLVRTGRSADESQEDQVKRPLGWAYVGSANMSESAWGRIVKDRGTGKTKMTCRNWECGVLVSTDEESNHNSTSSSSMGEDANMLDVFRKTLPVPIAVPGAKYISGESGSERKKPWFFLES